MGRGGEQGLFLLCSPKTVAAIPPTPICLLCDGLSVALGSASQPPHAWFAAAFIEGLGFPFLKRKLSSPDFLFCFPLYALCFYSPGSCCFSVPLTSSKSYTNLLSFGVTFPSFHRNFPARSEKMERREVFFKSFYLLLELCD